MKLRILLIALLTCLCPYEIAHSYDRNAAAQYAHDWYNTDTNGDQKVDHINTGAGYSFYWYPNNDTNLPMSSYTATTPINTVPTKWGWDCTNFVSQCLKAGDVPLVGHLGAGGTYIRAWELGGYLSGVSQKTVINRDTTKAKNFDDSQFPDVVEVGDVIIFDGDHSTIAIGNRTKDVILAAHSDDRADGSIEYYFSSRFDYSPKTQAIVYHLEQFTVTVDPPMGNLAQGSTEQHKVYFTNNLAPDDNYSA